MTTDRELVSRSAIVEAAPDAVVVSRNGVVIYANRAAAGLLGLTDSAELIGSKLADFIGPSGAETMRQRVEALLRGITGLPPMDYEATRRDGSRVVAEVTSVLAEYDGEPAILAVVRDVTDRTRLREQVARADRLAALGTAAAGMAHEINNPLQVASLATDALERKLRLEPDASTLLTDLRAALDRIASIVHDLRGFSQFGEEPMTPIDLRNVLSTAARFVRHQLPTRVELTEKVGALPPVPGNARQLEQVMVNLLMNALQAFSDDVAQGNIELSAKTIGEEVMVEVKDTGSGIPPEVLGRVFDPFFTTKPPGVGTGLGLAVCHGIVTRHAGTIAVESQVGQGTTVSVRLPVSRARPPLRRRGTPFPANAPSGLKILVVDEEPAIVRSVEHLLAGNEVVGTSSGEEAIRLLHASDFDVVICDLTMRKVTGRDVYEAAIAQKPELARHFIFMSGGAYLNELADFVHTTGRPLLEKPFGVAVLHATLFQALAMLR